jgi:hypothetical protein
MEVVMMQLRSLSTEHADERALPLIHWAAVFSGAAIASAIALVAGSLWAAAAFGSQNAGFYNHLDWWLGATLIGATFVGALLAGAVSSARGLAAGILNGLTSWAIIALAVAFVVLGTLVGHVTTATLTLHHATLQVGIVRPYVVFWAALIGLGGSVLGGAAGGLVPRRLTSAAYVESSTVQHTQFQTPVVSPGSNRTSSRAAS